MSRINAPPAPLYRRLPRGPSALGREAVARNQRARIHGAMIEAVARGGYARTTVADVITLAGVSRRTFYELFPSREACFLSTYDVLSARSRRLAIEAWQRERGWCNRLHAACAALLGDAARSPQRARLLLVEGPAAGPAALPHMRLAALAHERLVFEMLRAAPDGAPVSPLTARAIVGGMRQLATVRLCARRERELEPLASELVDWIEVCRSPASPETPQACRERFGGGRSAGPWAAAAPPAPPAAFLAGAGARACALRATAQLCAQEGFANASAERIARHAGISVRSLQRVFASPEACLLALLEELRRESLAAVGAPASGADAWPAHVHRAVRALLAHVAARRELVRIAFVDGFALGEALIEPMTSAIGQLGGAFTAGAPPALHAPEIAGEAVGGAVWAVACAEHGRRAHQEALVDHVAFLVLAPYLGARAAAGEIRGARAAAA